MPDKTGLKRSITLPPLFFYGVGIYALIGKLPRLAGICTVFFPDTCHYCSICGIYLCNQWEQLDLNIVHILIMLLPLIFSLIFSCSRYQAGFGLVDIYGFSGNYLNGNYLLTYGIKESRR